MTLLGNRFELLDRLGYGGMAEVFRARDRRLGRDVAIKLLNAKCSSDPGIIERFRQESSALAQLSHPNIVTLLDTGETDDGRFYLVMERLRGEGLNVVFRRLREQGERMPWRRLVGMVRQVCLALHAAHLRQIVHRDIKPSNLYRLDDSPDGEDLIKILDFGIAKFVAGAGFEDDAERVALTHSGLFVGTAHYAAPEAIEPTMYGPVDGRADVFALGVLLYQGISGAVPHDGLPQSAILSKTALDDPPPLRERVPHVAPAVETVVMRAIARRPKDRFASVRELADALAAVVELTWEDRVVAPMVDARTMEHVRKERPVAAPPVAQEGRGRPAARKLTWRPTGLTFVGDPAALEGSVAAPPGSRVAGPAPKAEDVASPPEKSAPAWSVGPEWKPPRGAEAPSKDAGARRKSWSNEEASPDGAPARPAPVHASAIEASVPASMRADGAGQAHGVKQRGNLKASESGGSALTRSEAATSIPSGPFPPHMATAGSIGDVLHGATEVDQVEGVSAGMYFVAALLLAVIVAAWWVMPEASPDPTASQIAPLAVQEDEREEPAAVVAPAESAVPANQPTALPGPSPESGAADDSTGDTADTPAPAVPSGQPKPEVAPAPGNTSAPEPAQVRLVAAQLEKLLAPTQGIVDTCAGGHVLVGVGTYALALTLEVVSGRKNLRVVEARRSKRSYIPMPDAVKRCVLEKLRALRLDGGPVELSIRREYLVE